MTLGSATTEAAIPRPKRSAMHRKESRVAWMFILPAGVMLLLFIVLPFALAGWFSLTNQRLISPLPTRFVGLDNYVDHLKDDLFWKSLKNTFVFAAIVVPLQSALALGLAIMVNQKVRGRVFFRTIYFTPVTVVMATAATVWVLLFNVNGLINAFLETVTFGSISPDWLNSTSWAMVAIIIVSIWQGVGFQMIILLAALQDVPTELYEASSIDGATGWQQFRHVTVPGIRNALIFVLTVTTILSFRLFDQPTLMPSTSGGPKDSTRTVMVHMVDLAFGRQAIGRGSAVAILFFLIVVAVTFIQRRFLKEEELAR